MGLIRIILVDDHDLVLDGLAAILRDDPHIQVVAKATSADLAEKYIRALQPEIVMTDISMGAKTGLDLTGYIKANFPGIKVIVLSMHDEYSHISSLLAAGATGYLLKNVKSEELYRSIRLVLKGETYIQSSIAASYHRSQIKDKAIGTDVLSPRELQILKLIAQENTTSAIASILSLSVLTVETHRKNMLRKTGSKSVVGLLAYAREHDLV